MNALMSAYRVLRTASAQPLRSAARASSGIWGAYSAARPEGMNRSNSPADWPLISPAPIAVRSGWAATLTRQGTRSACSCIKSLLTVPPPSAESTETGFLRSAAIASNTSAFCCAMDSSAARATCARVVPRLSPERMARADVSK